MAPSSYFTDYVDILSEAFKKIRKIGFKKHNSLKDIIDTAQNFLAKEVYGRIQPSNYLICLILFLGAKNPKLYPILIQAIQKLFSHNFISHNECLGQSLRMLKEEHKEFLLLPYEDYEKKIFKQIYIQTLTLLPEKDDTINLMIVKNYSLIWRLSQSSLGVVTIGKIFQFIVEAIIENKIEQNTQTLKSAFLEIVRHSFQSYKECLDYKLITDQNNVSVKSICYNYGKVLFDQVAIRSFVQQNYDIKNYPIIPEPEPQKIKQFKLLNIKQINQDQVKSGKFGWCINCRKQANFYCKINRIPVCSFNCKNKSLSDFQMVDKLVSDELRSANIFENHVARICRLFVKYLSGKDAKKTACFSQIFVFVSTELKKWNFSKISLHALRQLRWVFRQTIINIQTEHEAFIGSILSMKKMLFLRTFKQQTEILLKIMAKKLTHYLTPTKIKEQILKVIRQLLSSHLLFDYAYIFDCQQNCSDVVKDLIEALSKVYKGINIPEGITVAPEQAYIRKLVYELLVVFYEQIKKSHKAMSLQEQRLVFDNKNKKNLLKDAIQRFNKTEKPFKIIKALISEKYLQKNPLSIAKFLHQNIAKLSFSNIGVLIGGYDEMQIKVRDEFIKLINFNSMMIDEGIRKLLKHFTIPGQSQVVERIIDCFSKIFYEQNREDNIFHHSDAVYSFSYLLMMLQTNLHNPQVIQKMTLQQFANLSKGMNGPQDFKEDFLEKIYKSIQKNQLGFHQKMREMEIIIAYKQNPKTGQLLYVKELQRQIKQYYEDLGTSKLDYSMIETNIHYPIKIYSMEFLGYVLDVLILKVHETEEKQEVMKDLEIMQSIMKFSVQKGAFINIQRGIKNIWEQITKINTIKKYILMQKLLDWIALFDQHLMQQWNIVIYLFSKFHRNKLTKKQYGPNAKKDEKMLIMGDKCLLYEPFINNLWVRSSKYSLDNFKCLVEALIQINKQQINQNAHPFCLEKFGQIQEYNMTRAVEIFPILWPILKDHYVQLGKSKNEKIALFGTDFLKQLITKFLKKKDLITYQRQYMKSLQQIFSATKLFSIKEYIIGSLSYFINNHSSNLRSGWRVILPIICEAFDQEEDRIIKEKAFINIKKIYEAKFQIINLQQNYVDFVQILSRLPHEKDEIYPKGCIEAIKAIIEYYHAKYQINLEDLQAESNKKLDVSFWQTYFLPLLSTIYVICGDCRSEVQTMAIELLFTILMNYGKLFKYEFWKMVLQGILRPTFEQITYSSQSKPIKKEDLQNWLRGSFELLFSSINTLIEEYFQDFRMFLFDVLKIYQTCILSYNNKILIQLSIQSLGELMDKVGDKFQPIEWEEFFKFTNNIIRKTLPVEIFTEENWQRQKEMPQKSYEGKSFSMNLFFIKMREIIQKYPHIIQQHFIEEMIQQLQSNKSSIEAFNNNIELRKKLWEDGFFSNLKSLPGLLNQQFELIKLVFASKYVLSEVNEQKHFPKYLKSFVTFVESYHEQLIYTQKKSEMSLQSRERYRQSIMQRILIHNLLKRHLFQIQISKIVKYQYRQVIFNCLLNVMSRKRFCPNCQFCENCQMNLAQEEEFSKDVREYIQKLFIWREACFFFSQLRQYLKVVEEALQSSKMAPIGNLRVIDVFNVFILLSFEEIFIKIELLKKNMIFVLRTYKQMIWSDQQIFYRRFGHLTVFLSMLITDCSCFMNPAQFLVAQLVPHG